LFAWFPYRGKKILVMAKHNDNRKEGQRDLKSLRSFSPLIRNLTCFLDQLFKFGELRSYLYAHLCYRLIPVLAYALCLNVDANWPPT
jgi:hypothetical protein